MSTYYCHACKRCMKRKSKAKRYKAYCERAGRTVMMRKVMKNNPKEAPWCSPQQSKYST